MLRRALRRRKPSEPVCDRGASHGDTESGGVTERDVRLAEAIDKAAGKRAGP